MLRKDESYDFVVCGGGLAGLCAAVAAARQGLQTCLIQDRPVLGGNSSSEVRVPVHGACCHHGYARETGILSEILIEERARNHEPIRENGSVNTIYDLVLYDLAQHTPNLTVHLNTSVLDVELDGVAPGTFQPADPSVSSGLYERAACGPSRRLAAVLCRTAAAETERRIRGRLFADCTGDAFVADRAGCAWRMGSEGRDEFGEAHAPQRPSCDTMGNSLLFQARDLGRPVSFAPPDWAVHYDDARFFYEQGRVPGDLHSGYWWIEIGVPWHTIHGAEDIRHELTRHCLGIWDWIKNRDPKLRERAATFALDWVGQVPGKRESRRVLGLYFLTENDIQERTVFPDEIAYGGWFLDLHTPGGLLAPTSEPASAEGYKQDSSYAAQSYVGPYGLPLRILLARDVDNLLLAGRNVSVTHAALGTVRVMGTTALLGQAAGTAAAVALERGLPLAELPERAAGVIQQRLLRGGAFLLHSRNEDPADLARQAAVSASSEARLYGAAPGSRGVTGGLAEGRSRGSEAEKLTHRRGQWIALGTDRVNTLSVCLTNLAAQAEAVQARLFAVEDIWDYRSEPGVPLASAVLRVPVGSQQWIEWPVGAAGLTPGRYLRLDLLANPHVVWHSAGGIEPGHISAFEMAPGRMRRYQNGLTLSFRVDPPQPCYGAANVVNGVFRPHRFTNLWRSDPAQPLPQWVELRWPQPQTLALVELTFPGNLLREYHATPPFYHDPQCARDFTVETWAGAAWQVAAQVAGNYQRQRRIRLPHPVVTDRLRVVIHAMNGDPSAALYEVRCY